MDVFLANEQDVPVDEVRLSGLAHHVLSAEEVDDEAELSVLFVGPDHIQKLNARFAGEDHATDVLAFPMMEEEGGSMMLGDVVICPSVARSNAETAKHDLEAELDMLLVHGTLHLLGYDHQGESDKKKMESRLSEILHSYQRAGS